MSLSFFLVFGFLSIANEGSILAELERLDRALDKIEIQLQEISTQKLHTQKELSRMEVEIATVRVQQNETWGKYKERVQALSRMPAAARMALIGGARSLNDYLETARVLRIVAQADRKIHTQFQREQKRLMVLEKAIKKRQVHLTRLERETREQRDTLANKRQQRLVLLESVTRKKKLAKQVAKEHSKARNKLASMVKKMKPVGQPASKFARNKGRLPWPTAGKVSVPFGRQVEKATSTITNHNGWDIRAQLGEKVQAISYGTVVYADWLRGYGQLVIVDHGENYHSLHAHLSAVAVQVGQHVGPGSIIGQVGDTGSFRGTVLYFEIRHQGLPLDPSAWLRK